MTNDEGKDKLEEAIGYLESVVAPSLVQPVPDLHGLLGWLRETEVEVDKLRRERDQFSASNWKLVGDNVRLEEAAEAERKERDAAKAEVKQLSAQLYDAWNATGSGARDMVSLAEVVLSLRASRDATVATRREAQEESKRLRELLEKHLEWFAEAFSVDSHWSGCEQKTEDSEDPPNEAVPASSASMCVCAPPSRKGEAKP